MHVFSATVVRVVGQMPSLLGRMYRLELNVDHVGYIPGVVNYAHFPVSLLVLGEFSRSKVDVVIRGVGRNRYGYILPLINQGSGVTSELLGRCLSLVNHTGDEVLKALESCSKIGEVPAAGDLPIPFDPRVDRLERLMEFDIPAEDGQLPCDLVDDDEDEVL